MPKPLDRIERNREHDAKRRTEHPWRAWYSTTRWQALRKAQFTKQPLCERCLSRKRIVAASVAHHVVAHKGDEHLFWCGELASSCVDCHNIDEQRIERGGKARQAIDEDGWPLD